MYGYDYNDPYFKRYCKSSTSRRRLAVDTVASDAPSPYVFGLDMRIEQGTLYLKSNEVPKSPEMPNTHETPVFQEIHDNKSRVGPGVIAGCAVAFCVAAALGVTAMRKNKQTRKNAPPIDV